MTREASARRRAWWEWDSVLAARDGAHRVGLLDVPARPVPLLDGPVERAAHRSAVFALGATGAALLVAAGERAAGVLAAGVPKATRLARKGFAAQLDHDVSAAGLVLAPPPGGSTVGSRAARPRGRSRTEPTRDTPMSSSTARLARAGTVTVWTARRIRRPGGRCRAGCGRPGPSCGICRAWRSGRSRICPAKRRKDPAGMPPLRHRRPADRAVTRRCREMVITRHPHRVRHSP
jgi:hypothetical protein